MSGMTENTLCGLPLTTDFPISINEELEKSTQDQKTELEGFGLKINGIHILGEGAPPRFFIEFPVGTPSYEIRRKLEVEHYDVGQQMGKQQLRFYAVRRVKEGGWDV